MKKKKKKKKKIGCFGNCLGLALQSCSHARLEALRDSTCSTFSGGGSAQHHPVTTGCTQKAQAGLNFNGSGWKVTICSVVENQC